MSRKSATVWSYKGYDLMGDVESPYYIVGCTISPTINTEPLSLATGDVLYVGDTLAYLGGKKTSAGFDNLHPVAPFLFQYAGMFKDGDNTYVLWETGIGSNDEYASIYYGHSLFINDDGITTSLLYTNRAGSGRVIEAEIFHSSHDTIPNELFPKPYQKEMGLVE